MRVIREDVKNANLLFAGTESAAYASIDGGAHWVRLMNRMPTMPVADLIVHPRDGDLIAATHGRSFWVMDISPLQELTPKVLTSDAHLFTVKPAVAFDYRVFTNDEFLAEKRLIGENPAPGVAISYYLKAASGERYQAGDSRCGGRGGARPDGHAREGHQSRAVGSAGQAAGAGGTRRTRRARLVVGAGGRGADAPAAAPAAGGRGGGNAALVDPGDYVARLTVNGQEYTTPIHVEPDPDVNISTADMQTRRGVINTVIALQAKTEPANSKADTLDTQLDGLSKAVTDAAAPIKDAMASTLKESNTVKTEMARINRGVTQLFGQVSGSPFLPTGTQREQLEDLQKDFDKQSAALDKLLKTTVPELEKQLNDANVPRISVK